MTSTRFGTQIYLCEAILNMRNTKAFFEVADVLSKALNWKNAQSLLMRTFLEHKSLLSDDITQQMIKIATASDNTHDSSNDCQSISNDNRNCDQLQLQNALPPVSQLPKDVLNQVGSYLNLESSLMLSCCNRLFNRMVLNNSYLALCPTTTTLTLTPDNLNGIVKDNTILDYYTQNCHGLYISSRLNGIIDCRHRNVVNDENYFCCLCKLFDEMKSNYDRSWMKDLLSNIEVLAVDNNWKCAFEKLPLEDLLLVPTDDVNNNNQLQKRTIRAYDAASDLNSNAMEIIGRRYDMMWQRIRQSPLDIQIRTLGIVFNHNASNTFEFLEKLHGNYNVLYLDIPCLNVYRQHKFNSLEHFLKIFHNKVNLFEPIFNGNLFVRPWEGGLNIPAQLFNDQKLIDDLNKSDRLLSFEQLLNKYNIASKSQLPQISVFIINIDSQKYESYQSVFSFLNHKKILKLFNLENTVSKIRIAINYDFDRVELRRCMLKICQMDFTKVEDVQFIIFDKNTNLNGSKRNDLDKIYCNLLVDIFVYLLQKFQLIMRFEIRWVDTVYTPKKIFEIKINQRNDICDSRMIESSLKPQILNATRKSFQIRQTTTDKHYNDVFLFNRGYQV